MTAPVARHPLPPALAGLLGEVDLERKRAESLGQALLLGWAYGASIDVEQSRLTFDAATGSVVVSPLRMARGAASIGCADVSDGEG